MCDGENLEGKFIDRHTVQREKYLEGNLPRQTLSYICSLDDGFSPRVYSQKSLQPTPASFYVQKGLLFEWWSVCMWQTRLGWRRFLLCGVGAFQVQRKNQCGP